MTIFLLFAFLLKLATVSSAYSGNANKYLRFHWTGNLTSHSVTMKIFPYLTELESAGYDTYLAVYTKPLQTTSPELQIFPVDFAVADYPVTTVEVDSLSAATNYYYTFVFSDTTLTAQQFSDHYSTSTIAEYSFKTFGMALTAYNFTFGAASCAESSSNSPVFSHLEKENLDFFVHLGDIHYENIESNNANLFYDGYYKVFGSQNQKKFFSNTPTFYVWDDHDFGPNNAVGTSATKEAVTTAYKYFVPHSPLKEQFPLDDSEIFSGVAPDSNTDAANYLAANSDTDFGIFRSFIVGRCLIIVMDLRSFRDVISGDILGEEQATWLENQIRFAGFNDNIKMVILFSSIPWIDIDSGADWEDYRDTKQEIADLIDEHIYDKGKKIFMVSGDAHMLALDDGRNNRYGSFPVAQVAALDRSSSCKGGPYSHGISKDRYQYGTFEVTDYQNDTICVKMNLKKLGTTKIAFDTCHPELYPASDSNTCPLEWWIILIIVGGSVILLAIVIGGFFCYRRWKRVKALREKQNIYKAAEQSERKEAAEKKENEANQQQELETKDGKASKTD